MRISLITVCWNSAGTIRTALESALRQRGADFEYWVVDGGSTDGTVDAIRAYEPRFNGRMRWVSEKDRGMYDALNKGIGMSSGDAVGILNADDFLETDDALAEVSAAFGAAPDAQAVYADVRFLRPGAGGDLDALRKAPTLRYYSARHWRPWMLRWGYMPPHPGVYIRRGQFERLGGYKTDYQIAADYELLIRYLKRAGLPSAYLGRCLVGMRTGGRSTRGWRSNLVLNREIARGNRENGYFCILPMLLPKYFFKVWEFVGR